MIALLHFVDEAAWSDQKVLTKVREIVYSADRAPRADRNLDHRDDTACPRRDGVRSN